MSATQPVFGLEEVKGVLVIAPGGDAVSYRDIDVAREVDDIRGRIDALETPRVVVDLAGARYIGSIMIGAISDFAEHIRLQNGAFAVCNVSPEMASVLRVMNLDTRWPQCPTRQAAVKLVRKT
jgi:anti-anti-sigma factor